MAITMDWAASSTDVFLPVLEPGRPKIKVPANSISTKGLLPYLPSWCVLGGLRTFPRPLTLTLPWACSQVAADESPCETA